MKQGMKKQKTKDFSCVSQSFNVYIYFKEGRIKTPWKQAGIFLSIFFFPTIEAFCILMDKCPFGKKKIYILIFFHYENLYPIKVFCPGLWLRVVKVPLPCAAVGRGMGLDPVPGSDALLPSSQCQHRDEGMKHCRSRR